jgi:hypothetical protein
MHCFNYEPAESFNERKKTIAVEEILIKKKDQVFKGILRV